MMSEAGVTADAWTVVQLGEIAERRTTSWQPGGAAVPYVGLEHIRPYELELLDCGNSDSVGSNKTVFCEGDILYGKLRPYFRKCVQAPYAGVCSTDIWVITTKNPKDVDQGFLYWVLADISFSDFANQGETGTRMPRANWGYVSGYEVALPTIDEQRRIRDLLDVVATLIEQKRRLVDHFDQMIQAEGAYAIEASEEVTEVRLVDVATFTNGYSYTSEELVEVSSSALVNLKNFGRRGGFRLDGLKPFVGNPKASQIVSPGDVLVAKTDLTQEAEVVGRCMRMPLLPKFESYVASLDVAIVRPSGILSKEVILSLLSQPDFREHCLGYANGTTVLHLSKEALPAYVLPIPDSERVLTLDTVVRTLATQQDVVLDSLQKLIEARDALLPALLAGEITIEKAEQIVGGLS